MKAQPLGEAGWRDWLRARENTDLTPDQVLTAAEADLRTLAQEFRAAGAQISKSKSATETLSEVAAERMEPDAARAAAESEIGDLWEWLIRSKPAGVPSDDPILIRDTPAFRRRDVPIRAELAGGYCKTPQAYLEIAAPDPDWPPAILASWLSAYGKVGLPLSLMREVYPGRFVAWQKMRVSKIRTCKAIVFPTIAEGWALYAEELATRGGFRQSDPRLRLAMLADLIRADARLIASIRMHVKGLAPEDAAAWLSREAFWPREEAVLETDRLLADPDRAVPALGRLAILKLSADVKSDKGKAFSPSEFHARLLSFGSAPISAIRMVMLPSDHGPLLGAGK